MLYDNAVKRRFGGSSGQKRAEKARKRNELLSFPLSSSLCIFSACVCNCLCVCFKPTLRSLLVRQIHETGRAIAWFAWLFGTFSSVARRFNKGSGNIAVLASWNGLKLEWLISPPAILFYSKFPPLRAEWPVPRHDKI